MKHAKNNNTFWAELWLGKKNLEVIYKQEIISKWSSKDAVFYRLVSLFLRHKYGIDDVF
mgnify:CR=1 FL=1